jgi:hypothetical protein
MLARITNYNIRSRFPTCCGDIVLPRRQPRLDDFDPRIVEELKKIPMIQVEVLGKPFSKMKINELRAEAKKAGIERAFFLKKEELIKRLEESHGKHTIS